jgi:hypothetical protein
MITELRRRIAQTLGPRLAARADRARHVRGHVERLESRTVLSASIGALPVCVDGGLEVRGLDVRPELPQFTSGPWPSAENLAGPRPELQAALPTGTSATGFQLPAVLNILVPSAVQPLVEEAWHVVIVTVPDPSFWGVSGPGELIFPPEGWLASSTGGVTTAPETTRPTSSVPPGALGLKSTSERTDADEPIAPHQDAESGRSPAEPARVTYVRPPTPPAADPALAMADAASYSALTAFSTAEPSIGPFSLSDVTRLTTASLSAYDAVFEVYSAHPLALVWNIDGQTVPRAVPATPADSDDQGGFVALDGTELDDGLLPPDVARIQSDAIDAVLADLRDTPRDTDEHAAHATQADEHQDAQTQTNPEAAPAHTTDNAIGPATFSSNEGGMILLQQGGGDGSGEYSLAAVYMVGPDKLLEVHVEMEASVGIYQAFDVAAGDLRQADGKPVKAAEPLSTRPDHADEKVSTGDSRPAGSRQAAAWVGTLIVAGSSLVGSRSDAERRGWAQGRR